MATIDETMAEDTADLAALRSRRMRALKASYARYAADPKLASLRRSGSPLCPGRGSMTPRAVLVGEAPGEIEERERKPFRGPAGDVLTGVLTAIGLTRSDVFITNVVKYRPVIGQLRVRNRTPNLAEQMSSWPYIWEEIDVFRGVPVVCLGKVALAALGPPGVKVSSWHGTSWYDPHHTFTSWYHPAVAVYDPDMTPVLVDDARRWRKDVLEAPEIA